MLDSTSSLHLENTPRSGSSSLWRTRPHGPGQLPKTPAPLAGPSQSPSSLHNMLAEQFVPTAQRDLTTYSP